MLISDKQQQANQENAQHSTGPKTPEGKAASCLNALKYGLRARHAVIFDEDPEEYKQLHDDLIADWNPQNRDEYIQVGQMAYAQWMLARMAMGEKRIYESATPVEKQFALLRDVAGLRRGYERSFSEGMNQLRQLQKDRKAKPREAPLAVKPEANLEAQPVETPTAGAAPPDHIMADATQDQPVSATGTR